MKKFIFTLLIITLFFSCNNTKKNTTELYHLIPENTSVILKINDLESFKSDLKNNDFVSKLAETTFQKNINKQLENLDYLKTNNPVLICFENDNDSLNYSIITKFNDSLVSFSISDSLKIYSKIIDSIYVGSTSKTTINNLKINTNSLFKSLYKTTNNNSSFSIFINKKNTNRLGNSIILGNVKTFTNWMSLDTNITPDKIIFNGTTIINDTLPQLLKIFKNTIPQENTISQITPSNSDGFLSFTFDDFEVFQSNLNNYNSKKNDSLVDTELFQTINEIGEVYLKNNAVIVLKSIDAIATKEALLDHQSEVSNFRNIPIFEFSNSQLFKNTFYPLINQQEILNYIIIDDFFVFANSQSNLRHVITNFQNATTFANTNAFKDVKESLSDESSLLVVASANKLKQIISGITNKETANLKLNSYKVSAIQFVQDESFTHINGVIKKHKKRAQENSISEEFSVTLDTDIIMQPHFVINHRTKQKDIVVQDANNLLYLISNTGKILWKKKLNGSILGHVQQVDLYKNGRLQLAFATQKRIYIIDRNGNDVSPFPIKFNDEITQPLSIFDYDNNKDYRFLVTQNNVLLMLDNKGKTVRGFNYKKPNQSIKTQPKHFRVQGKDYIVFGVGTQMKILNRQGQNRIIVKDNITFSNNDIYLYKNTFTTTNTKGELIKVNLKGNASTQNLGLGTNHFIDATSKTLVSIFENNLNIKQKSYELDFGNYTAPKIFYLNDKIYVSITDLQTQKIYLFNSQAKLLNNFPVYGNSLIDLANIDTDNKLEFVVKGETNSIIVYQNN